MPATTSADELAHHLDLPDLIEEGKTRLLLAAGTLGDPFGRRRAVVAGLARFAVGSALAALSGPSRAHARSAPASESAPAGAEQPEAAAA